MNNPIIINGKEVDQNSICLDGVDTSDYPDFGDAFVQQTDFVDGHPLTEDECDELTSLVDVTSLLI